MSNSDTDPLECLITHEGDEKYIIAIVSHSPTNTKKTVLVSHALPYHSHIARWYKDYLSSPPEDEDEDMFSEPGDFSVTVRGGGIMVVDHEKKFIKTYGQSGGYGKPDRDLVERILRKNFPKHTLEVTVTSYIRD